MTCRWWNTAEAVATAGMDCVVKLWDLEKQECRQVFMGHERGVKALASNEGLRYGLHQEMPILATDLE
jgi:WD40 repeat protein